MLNPFVSQPLEVTIRWHHIVGPWEMRWVCMDCLTPSLLLRESSPANVVNDLLRSRNIHNKSVLVCEYCGATNWDKPRPCRKITSRLPWVATRWEMNNKYIENNPWNTK